MTATSPGDVAERPATGARSLNLDVLRAIAALYVLAGHAYLLSGEAIAFDDRHPVRLLINTGGAGVWLFFALSGYLIAGPWVEGLLTGGSLPGARAYGERRFLRIYPAYWVALAGVIAIGGQSATAKQLAVHGALLHNLVPGRQQALYFASWTLSLEVLFYLAVPAVALLVRWRWRQPIAVRTLVAGVLALWALSIAFTAAAPAMASGDRLLWLRVSFPSMLSMFCPGILVAIAVHAERIGYPLDWFRRLTTNRRATLGVVAVLSVVGAYGATAATGGRLYDLARQSFALASLGAVALAITRRPVAGTSGRLLIWLGTISYGIYLWQGVIIYALEEHVSLVPMRDTSYAAYVVHALLLLALTIPCAAASWYLIERPAVRFSKERGSAR